jgi:hypothetical protein
MCMANLRYNLLLLFLVMCACRSEYDFDKAYNQCLGCIREKPYSVDLMDAGRSVSSTANLTGGPLADSLCNILEEKRGQWKKSKRISYAPRLLFSTECLSLNVREDIVVLNIKFSDREWGQYISAGSDKWLARLIDILKESQ